MTQAVQTKRDELKLSENSRIVLERRYLKKDKDGRPIETPEDMFRRVAKNIASADKVYDKDADLKKTENEFYSVISRLEFLPNSPTLMNAGRDLQQLSACFVLPIEDSMESIFEAIKDTAMIHKCLTPETLVSTKHGIKRLGKLKNNDMILTDEGYFKIKGVYKNEKQIIYAVSTNRGYSIKGTAEHKVLIINDNGEFIWRHIGELKKGDWIVMKPSEKIYGGNNQLPYFKYTAKPRLNSGCFKAQEVNIPKELTPALAELIGIYIGDGANHRDGIRFAVGKDDAEMVDIVKNLSRAIFCKDASVSTMLNKGKGYEVSILSTIVKKWFEFTGITKISSREARIPEIIFKASEEIIYTFLRGLFSTDGCVRKSGHITLTTSSKTISEELQSLMFYIGIPTHRRYYNSTDSYQLSLCTKDGFIKFKEKIGFLLRRQKERLQSVTPEDIFKRGDIIPNQKTLLKKWYNELDSFVDRRHARFVFDDIINRPSDSRQITRQRVVSLLEENEPCPQFLKTLFNKNYFFVTVSNVTPFGVMDTYDITVANRHTYIANGFITHNSGGGTGFSFSRLRPKNSTVRSTGGISSGPVSFMKVFNAATQAVKQGGCVVPQTRISTEYGLVKIKSLGPKDTVENTWYPHNGRPFAVATDDKIEISDEFYNNGLADVKTIKTTYGYSVTTTPEHRLRVIDENGNYVWRYVKHLKMGDWMVLKKDSYFSKGNYPLPKCSFKIHFNAQKIKTPSCATMQLGEFVGFFIGDGAMSINERGTGRIIFTINDDNKIMRDYLCEIVKALFGIKPVLQKKRDDKSTNYFFNSTVLFHWLKQIGVTKKNALEADIPEIVFRGGRDFARGFLRGLFEADGCISDEGYISLSSISKELVGNVQLLLLSLGMPSRVSVTKNRDSAFGKNPLYRLHIITKEGMDVFNKKVGFISDEKNKRLVNANDKTWEFNDIIPNQERLLKTIYNGPGRGCGPNRSKKGANRNLYRAIQHYLPDVSASRNLTRSGLQRLVSGYGQIKENPTIQWFLKNKQFYDRIASIENGKSLTLDLSVPENNTYIANGFVSHNTRRGANMGILRVDHPDILEFITCKENDKEITNFNISVGITDDFMKKVASGEEYDLIDPHTKSAAGKLNAKEVFDLIVKMAHKNGEPGIIFLDKLNKDNPTPKLGAIESTNPCGEQPLLPYESCNLGSVNLAKMTKDGEVDWQRLSRTIKVAVHFLDNVIDMNRYPLAKIEKMTKANRKIGLGVMGFADMLVKLGVAYNSDEAIKLGEQLMKFVMDEALAASSELAQTRGVFPNFKDSIYNAQGYPRLRNATLTTIAPTGTLSIIADCSSGIEPLFALAYYRNVLDNDKLIEVNNLFKDTATEKGFYSEAVMKRVIEKGGLVEVGDIPEDVKRIFVTAHDISPEYHLRMQAAFQGFTHNAVSKTINFSQEADFKDVEKAYMLAYKLGCKGITIYRDKSRKEQVLNIEGKEPSAKETAPAQKVTPRPRPTVTKGTTTKVGTGCGNLYVTINEDDNDLPFEVFTQMGKAGGCASSQLEACARLVSLALRSGIEINAIIEQLRGIRCPSPSWEKGGRIFSCADAIARVIEQRLTKQDPDSTSVSEPPPPLKRQSGNIVGVCPDCGSALRHEEGCVVCRSCGYSKC